MDSRNGTRNGPTIRTVFRAFRVCAARGAAVGLAVLGGLSLTASGPATAQVETAEPRVYVVGVENLYYLPAYAVENGQYVGYARDLLDAFAADQGLRFEYRPLPVLRLYASLAAGGVDFKFPDNPNWNVAFRAEHDVTHSGPVMRFLDACVVRAGNTDIEIADVQVVGTVTGFTPWPWLDRIKSGAVSLTENADFTALVRQVLAGRVDTAYASIAVVNRVLDTVLDQPGALAVAPNLPSHQGAYLLSTIAHPDIIAAFDSWMIANAARVADLKTRHAVERGVQVREAGTDE